MKYSVGQLLNEQKLDKPLFFCEHQPNPDGSISKTCLSQWWLSSFEFENVIYGTAEHWMMAKKAELFNDDEIFAKDIKCKISC